MDSMTLEILEDGTITVKTSAISDANHMSADEMLAQLNDLMGGPVKIEPNKDAKRMAHSHQHGHAHTHR
jgi:hypothetical protein